MKSKQELIALKEKVEILNKKLAKLTEEELAQVCGGGDTLTCTICKKQFTSVYELAAHVQTHATHEVEEVKEVKESEEAKMIFSSFEKEIIRVIEYMENIINSNTQLS